MCIPLKRILKWVVQSNAFQTCNVADNGYGYGYEYKKFGERIRIRNGRQSGGKREIEIVRITIEKRMSITIIIIIIIISFSLKSNRDHTYRRFRCRTSEMSFRNDHIVLDTVCATVRFRRHLSLSLSFSSLRIRVYRISRFVSYDSIVMCRRVVISKVDR